MSDSGKLKLAVLVSGGGRTMVNIAEQIAAGKLDAEIALVVASRPDASGIGRAQALGLPTHLVARKQYPDVQAFSEAVWSLVRRAKADLVCLAGFLSMLHVPADYTGRVMNIHPSLLPKFGGKGMYGHHVHEAVIAAGEKESGCTVHLCDNEYDNGPVILQRTCLVLPGDTPDTLAARVFESECEAYPEAIRLWMRSRG